jgi:hypothetical protein
MPKFSHQDLAKAFQFTSEYGPGFGEKWSVSQSRQETSRLKRRLARYAMPFELIDHGNDVWELVPTSSLVMPRWDYMGRLYGPDRRDDSNRCRVGAYAYDHLSEALASV